MSPFLISTILSFLAFELLSLAQVRYGDNVVTLRIADHTSHVVSKTVAVLIAALIIAAFLLFVLVSVSEQHPYPGSAAKISLFLTSPSVAQVFYGFLMGISLGAFVNSQLRREANAPLQTRDKLVIAAIVLLMFLGLGGDSALRSIGSKLEKISLGAAGFNFEASLRSSSEASSPGLGVWSTNTISLNQRERQQPGSFTELGRIIQRDANYLALFKSKDGVAGFSATDAVFQQLTGAAELADDVTPPLDCLAAWQRYSGDSTAVLEQVTAFTAIFRRLGKGNKGETEDIAAKIVDNSNSIADHIISFMKENDQGILFMRKDDRTGSFMKDDDLESCRKLQRTELSDRQARIGKIKQELDVFITEGGATRRPYFAIGYASLLVWLGSDDAAAAILDAWLRGKIGTQEQKNQLTAADDWFVVRTRAMLAAHLENWIRKQRAGASIALRDFHLENLKLTMVALNERLANSVYFSSILKERLRNPLVAPGECLTKSEIKVDINDKKKLPNDPELYNKLFTSYASMKLTEIQNSISHPDYETRFAETTALDAEDLIHLDISCIVAPFFEVDSPVYLPRNVFKAQILDAYARSALAYTIARRKIEKDEASKERLQAAAKIARVGLEMIRDSAKIVSDHRSEMDYLRRIGPSEAVDTQEKLRRTLRDITQGTLSPEN